MPRVVGRGWAKRLILSGDSTDAKQQLEFGLVTATMPSAQLQVRVRELDAFCRRGRSRPTSRSRR